MEIKKISCIVIILMMLLTLVNLEDQTNDPKILKSIINTGKLIE